MPPFTREIECTAYCSCGYCCNWEWGLALPGPFYLGFSPSWCPVHLRKRNKGYWTASTLTGSPYYGLTADGSVPAQARPPIFSKMSLMQYNKLPSRILLPWRFFPRHGTIAADTDFYPFGTRMFISGYGWGEVEDRGSAIKGPGKIDLYHCSHKEALKWGRQKLQVVVVLPGQSTLDSLKIPRPIKDVLKGLNWLRNLFV
ncbi:uncharacterized protein LOC131050157 isoform X2 [Cryptomeria japonica]|uniref:uncharacterized protein LOC131050157 isoform X2 n=1 Tax=Cryptomeria japonica TaxID=3369 RepID=UPI0027DA808C|nr:uncharacterized protein LOC131050157 isoform X2 [Cryptomeria japonica]